jgi:hypothetical protein
MGRKGHYLQEGRYLKYAFRKPSMMNLQYPFTITHFFTFVNCPGKQMTSSLEILRDYNPG